MSTPLIERGFDYNPNYEGIPVERWLLQKIWNGLKDLAALSSWEVPHSSIDSAFEVFEQRAPDPQQGLRRVGRWGLSSLSSGFHLLRLHRSPQ